MSAPTAAKPPRLVYDPAKHRSLEALIDDAPPGAVIALPAGTFPCAAELARDVTLEGGGSAGTTLEGAGRAPILHVSGEGAKVRLTGITLRGGRVNMGGALRVAGAGADVLVEDCVFDGNRGLKGGGAVHVVAGATLLRRTLLRGNEGALGGAILVDRKARLTLEDVTLQDNVAEAGGALLARDGARVKLLRTTIRRNTAREGASALETWGSLVEAPEIEVAGGLVAGRAPAVRLSTAPGATAQTQLRAKDATLPPELSAGMPGFVDGGGNRYG